MSTLNYEIGGDGPRVALLHPVGLDLTFLAPVADILREEFTVLTLDQRGHGGSRAMTRAHSLEDYADDLHALLCELEFAPAAIIGFSFGGMVAQALAIKYPRAVSALVICACTATQTTESRATAQARGNDARRNGMADVLEATLDRWFTASFRAAGKDRSARERLLSDNPEGWAAAWYAMGNVDTLPRLSTITVPTLCIAGERDKSSPPSIVQRIADAIPGARFAVIAGAPHMLFIEHPEETARTIARFLREGAPLYGR
ncbi:MAG TPA: alpha/beta fold hydrolase [Pseudolabrys sp.]